MNNLEALIECYSDICQYEKKLSQDTLKAYRTDLAQFRAFVGGAEVSRDLLSQYIKYLNNSFAPRSVKRKLASLRAFYRLMETREAISQNPFEKLQIRSLRPYPAEAAPRRHQRLYREGAHRLRQPLYHCQLRRERHL